jgi:type III secretory pathway component EscS
MTIFDLLLISVVLAVVAGLVIALFQALTGHLREALRTFASLVAGVAIYVAIICIVSLSSTQKIKALGEPDCSDDWCMSPVKASFRESAVAIEFRVWSRAKRVTQREHGVNPFLVDERGERYISVESNGPPFDQSVVPNEQFTTVRVYRVRPGAATVDLILRDGFGPDTFVIGASQSLLHPRAVYRLRPAPGPV